MFIACPCQVRHIMFTVSLTNATIDALSDLEQAVTAAVCARPSLQRSGGCAGLLHRLFGWVVPALPMLTGRDLAVFWYNSLCRDLPKQLKQGWPSEFRDDGSGRRCRHAVRSASWSHLSGAS